MSHNDDNSGVLYFGGIVVVVLIVGFLIKVLKSIMVELSLLFTAIGKMASAFIGSPSMTGAVRESVRMFLPQNVLTKGCPKCPQSDRNLSLDCQIIKSFPAKG